MQLDEDLCYRALETRDARFDGRFFTGVTSTGVYCRPVCPARTPRRRNCRFFATAAAAAGEGFRPCLRCRPETSPGTPAWIGASATVSRALRLINQGVLVESGVDELAERLGIGGRHLRRLFRDHLGAAPVDVEQTRRIHFAKKLLDETELPITEIAFSAGFNSVRRFNGAMRATYGRSPRELRRREERGAADAPQIRLRLGYRPPYDWSRTLGYLGGRAIPGVEQVTDQHYLRSVRIDDYRGVIRVSHGPGDTLLLGAAGDASRHLQKIAAGVRAIFDLGADPQGISTLLSRDRKLRPLIRRHPGLRVPGTWDPFELAVRAILGQQVSVRGASTLAGRLVERYGEPLDNPCGAVARVFPSPAALAEMSVTGLGMPTKRAETVRRLARAVAADPTLLDEAADPAASLARLVEIPGVGAWTAHYIAMRALREPDAFPTADLGLRKAVELLEAGERPSARQLEKRAEHWRPWRAYAAMYLWNSLESQSTARRKEG